MVDIKSQFENGLNYLFKAGGISTTPFTISYYFNDDDYDEPEYQTLTGSIVTSGLLFPVKSLQGSEEALLLQEGHLTFKDKILYTGSFNSSGNLLFDIKGEKYSIIPDGIHSWEINGSTIYNKIYLRQTSTGSLY